MLGCARLSLAHFDIRLHFNANSIFAQLLQVVGNIVPRDNPLLSGLCGTFENSIEDVQCTSQSTIFLRESCNQVLMVCDHSAFARRSPHNAAKFDGKGKIMAVQLLDFQEALWLQLT